jgi:hypothetical protein
MFLDDLKHSRKLNNPLAYLMPPASTYFIKENYGQHGDMPTRIVVIKKTLHTHSLLSSC